MGVSAVVENPYFIYILCTKHYSFFQALRIHLMFYFLSILSYPHGIWIFSQISKNLKINKCITFEVEISYIGKWTLYTCKGKTLKTEHFYSERPKIGVISYMLKTHSEKKYHFSISSFINRTQKKR